jgi:ubiquinone/menaquinone biosynthesis C-methylase UbiE
MGKAIGVDSSSIMIAEAQKHSERLDLSVDFQVGDIYGLDYPDGYFDACRAERVLQHLEDPEKAFAEMVRVTRAGGVVGAFEPDWESLIVDLGSPLLARKIVDIFCDNLNRNPWIGRQLYRRFREAELTEVVSESFALTLTDPTLSRRLYNLDSAVTHGKDHGLLSATDLATWSDEVAAATSRGYLPATVTGFVVVGRKPGSTLRTV